MARIYAGLLLLLLVAAALPCWAADSHLADFLGKVPAGDLVPGADHYGPPQGSPPVAKVLAGEKLAGYAFVNADWVNSIGYSGQPIQILVGLAADGKIAGARLMAHHEPIVLIGIPPERIAAFIQGYVGRDVLRIARDGPQARPAVDIVSGATVTVTVIAESMVRSAIRVARAEGIGGPAPAEVVAMREIDPAHAAPADWPGLLGDGSVRHLRLSVGDVTDAFKRAGQQEGADHPEDPDPAALFLDLYVAPVSVPAIGKRLLGDDGFTALQQSLKPGQQAILLAGNGAYSFKGSGYVRGGIFDRIEVMQGDSSIHFRDRTHTRLGDVRAPGAPAFQDVDLFRVPDGSALDVDPAVAAAIAGAARLSARATRRSSLSISATNCRRPISSQCQAPSQPRCRAVGAAPEPSEPPMWHGMWRAKTGQISVLLGALGLLTADLLFPGLAGAPAGFLRPAAPGLHGVHAGLDRLVRAGAIVRRQCARLPQRPADGFPLGLLPDGAADFHPVVRDRRFAAVLEPRRLLRLAVSVRRLAGTDQPPRQAA